MFTLRSPHRRAAATVSVAVLAILTTIVAAIPAAAAGKTATPKAPPSVPATRWTSPGSSTMPSFYNPPSPLKPAAPGTIIRTQVVSGVPGAPKDATLYRILYHSRTITGQDIAVSGYIDVPKAAAPTGGRPVITWAHGTTGTARICAPSIFTNAPDASGIYLAPNLQQYIDAGYVVTATDYQGLGGPGIHPYLVGQVEGQNVLDAARAALDFPAAHASNRVVIVGHSQGGQSALYAGQLAPTYAPQLDVLGTLAIAPLTETAEALPLAEDVGETALLATAAWAWAHTYSDLSMSDLFVKSEIPTVDKLMSTTCENQVSAKIGKLPPSKIFETGFATNPALQAHLAQNSPGAVRTGSPILIVQGTADTTIPDELAEMFESTQCPAVGDDLSLILYPGATHNTILTAARSGMLSWIAARFSGMPAPQGCSETTAAA